MRRDYREPDDFEYEPTAHDEVLKRAQEHEDREQGTGIREQEAGQGGIMSASAKTFRPALKSRRAGTVPH